MTIEYGTINVTELDQLDHVMNDPLMKTVVEKARIFNILLASEVVTDDDINGFIVELDKDWAIFMKQNATVTGRLTFRNDDGEVFIDNYFDHEVRSNGFVAMPMNEETHSDETTESDKNTKYEIQHQVLYERIDNKGRVVIVHGTAALDDVYSLDFPTVMSAEYAKVWLEYFCPDAIDEIDIALLNDAPDECVAVMKLDGTSCDLTSQTHKMAEEDVDKTSTALRVYTHGLFDFDKEMPYKVSLDGSFWQLLDDNTTMQPSIIDSYTTCATVGSLVWTSRPGDDDALLSPHLTMVCLTDNKDEAGYRLIVPVSTMTDFQSLRRMHYGPLED